MSGTLEATGERWALATPHYTATQVGARAFANGGNAVDAALAAAIALAVVYPHNCSLGGDLFAVVRRPDGEITALNSSGPAPAAASAETVRALHSTMPELGPLTVTVPGVIAGWDALSRIGSRLPMSTLVLPALTLAKRGVPVTRSLAAAISEHVERLASDPGCAAVLLNRGRPLRVGEPLVQPALAETLATLATDGAEAVYGGPIGASWVECLSRIDSPIVGSDLLALRPLASAPLAGRYRGVDILVPPPNSQGFVLILILAAIEKLGLDPSPLGPDAPALAELFAHASSVRDQFLADPRHVEIDELLSGRSVAEICTRFTSGTRMTSAETHPRRGDTIALAAIDADGWAVSLIQSVYGAFGAMILDPATGVVFQNRGAGFSLDPASPNFLQGGKRPSHTLMPVMIRQGKDVVAVAGSMGGGAQPQINAINLLRLLDGGMTPGDAVSSPRWLVANGGSTPELIEAEADIPQRVLNSFRDRGQSVVRGGLLDERMGHAVLLATRGGMFQAAADPRSDGSALAR